MEFFIPGKVTGKARARTVTMRRDRKTGQLVPLPFAKTYTPEQTENYAGLVQFYAKRAMNGEPMIEGPLCADFVFLFAPPASWSKKKTAQALLGLIRPEVKPDYDNAMKLVTDALNALAYRDDVSIVDGSWAKCYATHAGMWVRIERAALESEGAAVERALTASQEQEPF